MRFETVHTCLSIRRGDLDSAGHVNHARALEYFEQGRWEWLQRHRLKQCTRVVPVVSRVEIDYRKELFCGRLRIETERVHDDAIYKAMFDQRIYAGDATEPSITASVHVAFIDVNGRQLCTVDDFLCAAVEPLQTLAER
ncbi:thioesterase family protein [Xenorhabdus sp. TH1]|uniref:acyl-CoA thioesterase n=1 Tax=Xenorhabdus sp. TH1 TaxID=3130166 RepID=UPI0030CCA0C7